MLEARKQLHTFGEKGCKAHSSLITVYKRKHIFIFLTLTCDMK